MIINQTALLPDANELERLTTRSLYRSALMATNDCNTSRPNGQDLPPRKHINKTNSPTALTALVRQLCPGLTPAMALAWLVDDLAFEAEAVRQAAGIMGGEWEE